MPGLHTDTWKLYPKYRFFEDFPSLSSLNGNTATIQAIRRTLDRAELPPASVAATNEERQLEIIQDSIRGIEEGFGEIPASNPAQELEAVVGRLAAIRDLRRALVLLPETERRGIQERLAQQERRLYSRRLRTGSDLISDSLSKIHSGHPITQAGRTINLRFEDGSVIAFKKHSDSDSEDPDGRRNLPSSEAANREGRALERAVQYGLKSPIALVSDVDPAHTEFYILDRAAGSYDPEVPFLKPAGIAEDYETYLNTRLPASWTKEEKAQAIEAAALNAADDMLVLFQNGEYSESLLGISHNNSSWEGDYWRWNASVTEGTRYGPSFIDDWRRGFAYPNTRFSGMGDPEHFKSLEELPVTHVHKDHGGNVRHDAYSLAFFNNQNELAMTLLDAGRKNGLSHAQTEKIISNVLRRYLTGILPPEIVNRLDWQSISRSIQRSSQRFRFTAWAIPAITWFIRILIPGALIISMTILKWHPLAIVGSVLLLILIPLMVLHYDVGGNLPGRTTDFLPGWALDPLVMQAIKPIVELMREHHSIVGWEALEHPSVKDSWIMRQTMLATLMATSTMTFVLVGSIFTILAYLFPLALAMMPIKAVIAGLILVPLIHPALFIFSALRKKRRPKEEIRLSPEQLGVQDPRLWPRIGAIGYHNSAQEQALKELLQSISRAAPSEREGAIRTALQPPPIKQFLTARPGQNSQLRAVRSQLPLGGVQYSPAHGPTDSIVRLVSLLKNYGRMEFFQEKLRRLREIGFLSPENRQAYQQAHGRFLETHEERHKAPTPYDFYTANNHKSAGFKEALAGRRLNPKDYLRLRREHKVFLFDEQLPIESADEGAIRRLMELDDALFLSDQTGHELFLNIYFRVNGDIRSPAEIELLHRFLLDLDPETFEALALR